MHADTPARSGTGRRRRFEHPRVLVVDDVKDNRELYAEYLAFKGCDVAVATNGAEALCLTTTARFDIIVMDIAMPLLDGCEATRRLRASAPTRNVPIIAVSGYFDTNSQEKALTAGCDRYLGKPLLPEDLHTVIAQVLEERRRQG